MSNPRYLSVGAVADRIQCDKRTLSRFFYEGRFRDDLCPLVGGRRMILFSYLPQIVQVLRRHGKQVAEDFQGFA